jgi:hypothetical protein
MITQPLPLETARLGMSRQQELIAPVKFSLTPDGNSGCAIAEIPLVADPHDCEKLAGQALDMLEAWIESGYSPQAAATSGGETPQVARDTDDPIDSEIARTLDEIGWSWETTGETGYRVHLVTDAGSLGRVEIQRIGSNAVRASSVSTVEVNSIIARDALDHFALESNRRLRIARITVSSAEGEATQLVWDAVAPAALPVAAVLPRLIDSVGFARSETNLALVALSDESIAAAYLDHRFPMPRKTKPKRRSYSSSADTVPVDSR